MQNKKPTSILEEKNYEINQYLAKCAFHSWKLTKSMH